MIDVAKLAHHWATCYPEKKFEGDGLDDPLHAAVTLGQEWRRLRDALRRAIVIDDYDCPGDAPEKCGVFCIICRRVAGDEGDLVHKETCPASDAFARVGEPVHDQRRGKP